MSAKKITGSRLPLFMFLVYFGVLLLMAGVHTGFIVLATEHSWPVIVQICLPMLYWALIAAGLTAYTRASIKRNYDIPFSRVSEAAEKVAAGDFSVRLAPVEYSEVADYLDRLVSDFNKMVEELAGVETLRADFIANVSHELKTPLSVIQSYGVLLQQPELSEEQRLEYAGTVAGAARRMTSLITNILKLNKLENQKILPAPQSFDLGEQLRETLLGFEDAWEAKGLEIETDIPDGVTAEADPELLSLIWSNLFSNAIKFTPPGGRVSVSLSTGENLAVVRVADTGCGMSPEVKARIFDKFYQGDSSHATEGNGLGLALVRRIIDIASGEISVESEPGRGSVFTVRLKTDGKAQDCL